MSIELDEQTRSQLAAAEVMLDADINLKTITNYYQQLNAIDINQLNAKARINLEQAKANLIRSVVTSLPAEKNATQEKLETSHDHDHKHRWKFAVFTLWGTLFAASLGFFDGVNSVLSLLAMGNFISFMAGAALALIGILAYYAFDMTEIGKRLKISSFKVKALLRVYNKQQDTAKQYYQCLDDQLEKGNIETKELKTHQKFLELIKGDIESKQLALRVTADTDGKKPWNRSRWWAKQTLALTAGIFFFTNGFFIGEAAAFKILGVAALSAAASTPFGLALVLTLGLLCGAAAYASFHYFRQRGMHDLVDKIGSSPKYMRQDFCNSSLCEEHQSFVKSVEGKRKSRENLKIASLHKQIVTTELAKCNEQLTDYEKLTKQLEAANASQAKIISQQKISAQQQEAVLADQTQTIGLQFNSICELEDQCDTQKSIISSIEETLQQSKEQPDRKKAFSDAALVGKFLMNRQPKATESNANQAEPNENLETMLRSMIPCA